MTHFESVGQYIPTYSLVWDIGFHITFSSRGSVRPGKAGMFQHHKMCFIAEMQGKNYSEPKRVPNISLDQGRRNWGAGGARAPPDFGNLVLK